MEVVETASSTGIREVAAAFCFDEKRVNLLSESFHDHVIKEIYSSIGYICIARSK